MIVSWETIVTHKKFDFLNCSLFGFGVGLAALSKSPLASLAILFSIIYAIFLFHKSRKRTKGILLALWVIFISILPSMVWREFVKRYDMPCVNYSMDIVLFAKRFLHPNFDIWQKIIVYFSTYARAAIYYLTFSIVMCIFFLKKKESLLFPVLIILFVWFYYGYYYSYGSSNTGDYESSLRYMMPSFLSIFYLGGVALESFMESLNYNFSCSINTKHCLILGIGVLAMLGLF
jgi:hypothetical protein